MWGNISSYIIHRSILAGVLSTVYSRSSHSIGYSSILYQYYILTVSAVLSPSDFISEPFFKNHIFSLIYFFVAQWFKRYSIHFSNFWLGRSFWDFSEKGHTVKSNNKSQRHRKESLLKESNSIWIFSCIC